MKDSKDILVERFNAYTKTSLRHCLYHIRLKKRRLEENETVVDFSECNFEAKNDYDFLENSVKVMGFDMIVKNDLLYEALRSLEQYQRDIIYLSICERLSDRKIGTMMNMSRSKVQRIKVKVKEQLIKAMKGDVNDEKNF